MADSEFVLDEPPAAGPLPLLPAAPPAELFDDIDMDDEEFELSNKAVLLVLPPPPMPVKCGSMLASPPLPTAKLPCEDMEEDDVLLITC